MEEQGANKVGSKNTMGKVLNSRVSEFADKKFYWE